jgi:hypothetical protein
MQLFKPRNIPRLVTNTLALAGERDKAAITPAPPQIGSGMPDGGASSIPSIRAGSNRTADALYSLSSNAIIDAAIPFSGISTIVDTTTIIEVSMTPSSHGGQEKTPAATEATSSRPFDTDTKATRRKTAAPDNKHIFSDKVVAARRDADFLTLSYPARSRKEREMFPRPAHELREVPRYKALFKEFQTHSGTIHEDPRKIQEKLLTNGELDLEKLEEVMRIYAPEDVHLAVLGLHPKLRQMDTDVVTSVRVLFKVLQQTSGPDFPSQLVLPLQRTDAITLNVGYLGYLKEYQGYIDLKQGLIPIILLAPHHYKKAELGMIYAPEPDLRVAIMGIHNLVEGLRNFGADYLVAAVGREMARTTQHPAFRAELFDMMGKLRQYMHQRFHMQPQFQRWNLDVHRLEVTIAQGLTDVLSGRFDMFAHNRGHTESHLQFLRIARHLIGDRRSDKGVTEILSTEFKDRIPDIAEFAFEQLPINIKIPPRYKSRFYALTGPLASEGLHTIAEAWHTGDPEALQRVMVAIFIEHKLFFDPAEQYAFWPEIYREFIDFLYPDSDLLETSKQQ